ncbi:MAG: sulfatase-like hydrolase/transferase, partial [Deltaproteobacteria bacterium]|nr:sulfatase-like hydrolase/transferase [Deltaproteobacteria bacterium]
MLTLRTVLIVLIVGTFPMAAYASPNVLLIIADDMGIDTSRCYSLGSQQAPMPNIEAMCASGMVFDNAYAAPVCSPTRATIMTGQY